MDKKEYTVEITAEVTYEVKILASDKDEAAVQAKDNYWGPCTLKLKNRTEPYEGYLREPWAWCDIHVVEDDNDIEDKEE